ncbi:4Fe-4S double cluster binding domain-containing protein [Helicovermis profundi]|uniref:4Fe-4S ferredoxin-type domain-containing protein n=1 Tax=Helicovermis profundi TaxID=3065157 RepID=A0AAU9E6Z0_9FIRM|nr:hypothetical protein HLPR_22110 [Clostridia bacterium S502]
MNKNDKIINELENKGFKAKFISINSIDRIKPELDKVQSDNPFVSKHLSSYFDEFNYDINSLMKTAKSILIIATPDPISRIGFTIDKKKKNVIMPPMYLYNSSVKNEINQKNISRISKSLDNILSNYDYKSKKINLPAKLLAVKSGLGKYGKNNICYIDGLGSFMWLSVYLTDVPCFDEVWVENINMDKCSNCNLCLDNCPTKALSRDRYVLKANKCITFHNESEKEFPKWIEKSNAIIGCIRCQIVCPLNKSNSRNIVDISTFNESETNQILNKVPLENFSKSTLKKLDDINFIEYYELLQRNLKLLL